MAQPHPVNKEVAIVAGACNTAQENTTKNTMPDALERFAERVKCELEGQPQVWSNIADAVAAFKQQSINAQQLSIRVQQLLEGHDGLIREFSALMPQQKKARMATDYPQDEYTRAVKYVRKVKARFASQPHIFKEYLSILATYKQGECEPSLIQERVQTLFGESNSDLANQFMDWMPKPTEQKEEKTEAAAVETREVACQTEEQDFMEPPSSSSLLSSSSTTCSEAFSSLSILSPSSRPTHKISVSLSASASSASYSPRRLPLSPRCSPSNTKPLPSPHRKSAARVAVSPKQENNASNIHKQKLDTVSEKQHVHVHKERETEKENGKKSAASWKDAQLHDENAGALENERVEEKSVAEVIVS